MIDIGQLSVLVVTDSDETTSVLSSESGVSVTTCRPGAVESVLSTDVDCIVTTDPERMTPTDVTVARVNEIPVVAYTADHVEAADLVETGPSTDWLAGVVRRETSETDRLLEEIRHALVGETTRQLRRNHGRVTRLHAGAAKLATAQSPEELYRRTVDVAADILEFDICYVGIVEDGEIVPRATSANAPAGGARRMRIDEGIAGKTLQTGSPQLIRQVETTPEAEPSHEGYRSGVSVPIGDVGVFQAVSTSPAAFDRTDLELADLLASHVTESLSRLRAEADSRARREKITRLHEGTADLVSARTPDDLFSRTIDVSERILEFDQSLIFVAEADEFVSTSMSMGDGKGVIRLPLNHGLLAKSHRTGESFLVDDLETHPVAKPIDILHGSALSVPIGDVGVFQAIAADSVAFDEADLELAELLISHVTAALKRIEAEADLRNERDRLDALFEHVPDAALSFEFEDDRPIVRRVNSTFESVFGYDAETIVGEDIDDYIVPDDRDGEAESFNTDLRSGESLRAEVRRLTADGPRDFLLHVVPIQLEETNSGGYAIYTDVTDQKGRERELRRQNERLDEFASIVSHDLRNPLTIADGYLELAREDRDDPNLEKVAGALDRMGRLVDDLLTLARKGQVVGDTVETELDAVARRAWDHVETAGATLVIDSTRALDADPDRLVELFENLFRNVVEHAVESDARRVRDRPSESGTGRPTDPDAVEIRVGASDEGFYVADDGPGISADELERVFESGYTTADAGNGLGLAIVRRIAEAHGWRVTAVETDVGARFEFSLND